MGELNIRVERDQPTLRERATEKLRTAILSHALKPGERLVERDLCEQTRVSRTCVREALQHLEAEGLVVRQPSRGYVVAAVTADEARQIYEVRAALERAMGRHFALRASEAEIAALESAVGDIEAAIELGSTSDYVRGLDAFYEIMLRGARNETAHRLLAVMKGRITYLRTLTSLRSTRRRERETARLLRLIAQAAARRDADEVAERCDAFVGRSGEFAIEVLVESQRAEDEDAARSTAASRPRSPARSQASSPPGLIPRPAGPTRSRS